MQTPTLFSFFAAKPGLAMAVAALTLGANAFAAAPTLKGGVSFLRDLPGLRIVSVLSDPDGSTVVAGIATKAGLPSTSNALQAGYVATSCGISIGHGQGPSPCGDAYIARFGARGELLYGTYLGGSGADGVIDAALGNSGDIYVLGTSGSDDFPLKFDTGKTGTFVIRIGKDGSLGFTRAVPVAENANPLAMAVSASGIYIAGAATAGGIGTSPGALQARAAGKTDAFVMKLDSTAENVVYSSYLGGSEFEVVAGLAVDRSGNTYVAGSTQSADFPVTSAAWHPGGPLGPLQQSVFVSVVNASGTALLASSVFGGESSDIAGRIALAANGDILVAGIAASRDFPTTVGSLQTDNSNSASGFLVRLPPDLSAPVFSTFLDRDTTIADVAADADDSIVVTGGTASRFFPVTADALERCHGVLADTLGTGFLARIAGDGTHVLYASFVNTSATGLNVLRAIPTPAGNIVIAAMSNGYDLSYYGGPKNASGPNDPASAYVFELDADKTPSSSRFCMVNAASLNPALTNSGELITLFGSDIGPAEAQTGQPDSGGRYPVQLADTRVSINGQPAALLYAASGQINAWMPPFGTFIRSVHIEVERDGRISAAGDATTLDEAAGLFRVFGTNFAAAMNEDGSTNEPFAPAPPGSRLTLYGTGFGETAPQEDGTPVSDFSRPLVIQPQVFLNTIPAQVLFAGQAPGGPPGLIRIDVKVPDGIPSAPYRVDWSIGTNFQLGVVDVWVGTLLRASVPR